MIDLSYVSKFVHIVVPICTHLYGDNVIDVINELYKRINNLLSDFVF